jgi:2-dehydropantoate 2-reductase
MSESPPSLLIVGTGAMACLFAARLSQAGAAVAMTGTWPEGLRALKEQGVRLVDPDGQEQAFPVRVVEQPVQGAVFENALVLVKAWQTGQAGAVLAGCLSPAGLALSIQNGLGNREKLVAALGEGRVAVGSSTTGAHLLGPGRVQAAGEGALALGVHERLPQLAQLLAGAGFGVEMHPRLDDLLWGKLVINAAINPLTALLNVPNGELLERPEALCLLRALAREAARVAEAKGAALPYPDAAAMAERVALRTAKNRSSMLQDVARAAPTEIDAICGAVVRAGEETGIPTPINHTLWLLVKALVKA